jgi:RHS repeat-associated protein
MLVEWDYTAGTAGGSYKVTMPDRTTMIFATAAVSNTAYMLSEIIDQSGNAISFNYGPHATNSPPTGGGFTMPLLSSITNSAGTTLLSILRSPDGTGNIWSISDCYGRAVYYNVSDYSSQDKDRMLDHVSQVVPACDQNPPDRFQYEYKKGPAIGLASYYFYYFMSAIDVPSPTGSGSARTIINYDPLTHIVKDVVDPNGNDTQFFSTDIHGVLLGNSNFAHVVQRDSGNNILYQYIVAWDSNMSETTRTNGSLIVTSTRTYSDPNDPYTPSAVTDGLGHTYSYVWDAFGNLLTATSPRGTVTTNTYSYANFALGELTSAQTGSKQPITLTYYEPSGLIHQVTAPAPGTVGGGGSVSYTFAYDTLGNVTSEVSPGNATSSAITTSFGYTTDGSFSQSEGLGQLLTVTDNLGKITHLRYDPQGNVTSIVDALGNETDLTYNIVNDGVATVFPATGESGNGRGYSASTYLYPGGPLISQSLYDESGSLIRSVSTMYGPNEEVLSVSGSTEPVSYSYDGLYRVKTLTDGNGHSTTYNYNANGWLSSVDYPNANPTTGYDIISYPSYDALGDLLTRVDGRGIVTNYAYADPEGFLTAVTYPSSPGINASYSYDAYGRVSGVTDGAAASPTGPGILPAYDDDDDTTSVQTTYIGQTAGTYLPAQTISYTYNPDGSTATMVSPAGTFTYGYDADGRSNSLTNPFSETTNWTYLDNGWMKSRALANGVTTTSTFNALGQLLDMVSKNVGSTVLSEFNIPTTGGYDGAGNILSRTDTIAAHTAYSGSTGYQYDIKDQLTQEASTRVGGYTNNFAYDGGTVTGAGNPTSFKGGTNTFNADNQYTDANFTYDGEGNPTTYNGTSLTFDAEDRMTAYGTVLTNGYMDSGLRAWKQDGSGNRTYFLYDGETPVCELDASGDVTATNTFGPDGLISRRVGSNSTFYAFDIQGGTAQRFDSSGNALAYSMFDAYGTRAATDGSTDPFSGYGAEWGYYTDSETGLELCTHRFYDPSNGRWINTDPIGYNGGVNRFSYVGNNPISYADPVGLLDANQIDWNGQVYTRNRVSDPDINKGYPHWDGGDRYIDREGVVRDSKSKLPQGRPLDGKALDRLRQQRDAWDKAHPDKRNNSQAPEKACQRAPAPNPVLSLIRNLLPTYINAETPVQLIGNLLPTFIDAGAPFLNPSPGGTTAAGAAMAGGVLGEGVAAGSGAGGATAGEWVLAGAAAGI